MPFIKAIPSEPQTKICESHGEYEYRYTTWGEERVYFSDYCPKCADEQAKQKVIDDKLEEKRLSDERELIRRERCRINAGISKRNLYKTFEAYQCTNEGQTKAKNDCMRYVENFPHDKSMLMVGGVGTGKTLLASAMIDQIVDDHNCEIIKLIDLVRSLKATWSRDSNETEENLIRYYSKIDLLVIDEVGSQFGSDTEKLFIFDIIDGRYQNMKPTVLISNLDIDGIKDAIGERCVDRLREGGGMMVAFDWSSSRV